MKVGLIYTSTTPELIELVEQEVKKQLGDDVELYSLQDPSILADVRAAGYVTTAPAARLIGMYMKAAEEGVDAMLNLCSSVGEVADSAQDVAKYIGVPIVRVDEEMCREAVRKGQRIGVMATLPTTLEPTKGHHPAHGPRVQQTRGAGGLSGGRCIRFGSGPVQGPHDRDGRYHCRQGGCDRVCTGQHGLLRTVYRR